MSRLDSDEKRKKYEELMARWLNAERRLEELFPLADAPLPKGKDIQPRYVDWAELETAKRERDRAEEEFRRLCTELFPEPHGQS